MIDNKTLWNRLLAHCGHQVVIVTYGDPDDPEDVCLECEDCGEVVLSAGVYTICAREPQQPDEHRNSTHIEVRDPAKLAHLLFEVLHTEPRYDGAGQKTTPYYALAHDSETNDSINVSLTFETANLKPEEFFFSIHVIDDITPSDCHLVTCAPTEKGLEQVLDDVLRQAHLK